ncbi:MAG: HEPN domain-containing protein [Ignavibacteria bacterium]|nr:HEPN domain-containing protein [Ignavibacteria bacterium]
MKTRQELVEGWLDKAERDFATAQQLLSQENVITENVCFHSQQAVEKFLKAYLVFLGVAFPKTHEIGELITLCEQYDDEIEKLKIDADTLTDYAVEIRYPDVYYVPTIEEAKESISIAAKVKELILKRIGK